MDLKALLKEFISSLPNVPRGSGFTKLVKMLEVHKELRNAFEQWAKDKGLSEEQKKELLNLRSSWLWVKTKDKPKSAVGKSEEQIVEQVQMLDLSALIPDDFEYYPRKIGKKDDLELLQIAYKKRFNTLIEGPTGVGKTMAVRKICAINRIPFFRVCLTGQTEVSDLVGQWVPTESGHFRWNDGLMLKAIRWGGCLLIDELNAAPAEVLLILHSLLDDDRVVIVPMTGEIIKAHQDLWVVCCCNPSWYEGLRSLNRALRDRFDMILRFDPWYGWMDKKLIALANALAKAEVYVSPRRLERFRELLEAAGPEVAFMTLLGGEEGFVELTKLVSSLVKI